MHNNITHNLLPLKDQIKVQSYIVPSPCLDLLVLKSLFILKQSKLYKSKRDNFLCYIFN